MSTTKLSVSEREIYPFSAANGQIEAQPEGEKVISIDFPGMEVFNRSVTTKVIESCDSFLKFRSKADSVCCRCVEANAQSMAVLRVNNLKLRSRRGAKVFKSECQ